MSIGQPCNAVMIVEVSGKTAITPIGAFFSDELVRWGDFDRPSNFSGFA